MFFSGKIFYFSILLRVSLNNFDYVVTIPNIEKNLEILIIFINKKMASNKKDTLRVEGIHCRYNRYKDYNRNSNDKVFWYLS